MFFSPLNTSSNNIRNYVYASKIILSLLNFYKLLDRSTVKVLISIYYKTVELEMLYLT